MATKKLRRVWTPREDDIAAFLFRTPATTEQLFAVSQTWTQPFASLDRTQRRLKNLERTGWVSRSRYATASQFGGIYFYQLTLKGYRLWRCEPNAAAPTKRFFTPAADMVHRHQFAKAQFLTHLTVAAHARGFHIENEKPENTLTIQVADQAIRPDHYLELVGPYGRRFRRFFEFDRSTETQLSTARLHNTWTQKNLVYNAYQDLLGRACRFRVVPVTTASRERLVNILQLFSQQTTIPNRQLYIGVYLDDFLAEGDALCHPIFADHRQPHVALIPPSAVTLPPLGRSFTTKKCQRKTRKPAPTIPRYDPMPVLRPIGWGTRAALAPYLNAVSRIVIQRPRLAPPPTVSRAESHVARAQ